MSRSSPKHPQTPTSEPIRAPRPPRPPVDLGDEDILPAMGERLRQLALGSLAALIACRAYFPGENASTGTGLTWIFLLLLVAGLAILATVVGGSFRPRFSLTDLVVVLLIVMVGMSAGHAKDRRAAIILAWEWGGLAIAYLLARQLPRTKGESQALFGVLAASAVAVAAFGFYQIQVELAPLRALFKANPAAALAAAGIPADSLSQAAFEDRLIGSNEPFSTFALTNSLAGFLIGPLVLGISIAFERIRKVEALSTKIHALVLAAVPGLILASCLLATKSRSAYLGTALGITLIAVRAWGKVSTRMLIGLTLGGVVGIGSLVAIGISTRQLDIEVITESSKSLKYRMEYWRGTWDLIQNEDGVFWNGLGPGNFGTPYLLYKLPQASEEIVDPHNFILEIWSTAGLPALLALVTALGLGFWNLLRPFRQEVISGSPNNSDLLYPKHATWLIVFGSLSWILICFLGDLNPFQPGLTGRWVMLGLGWAIAVVLASPLWRNTQWPTGAAAPVILAMTVNLLAAGGLGIPPVALCLWVPLAIGLNLREDQACGRLRAPLSRWWLFIPACLWSAVMGTFVGAIGPHWKSQSLIAQAQTIMKRPMPDYDLASKTYLEAAVVDPLAAAPWLGLADLEYSYYLSPASQGVKNVWSRVLLTYDKAVAEPRPNTVALQRRRAAAARNIYSRLGENAIILEDIRLLSYINRANRIASQLYPTSAILHAELALSSSNIGLFPDAVREGREALRLSELTPHRDKKLSEKVRKDLEEKISEWEKAKAPEEIPVKPEP